ncbi:MAG TPA: lipocalin-like domain-containing protein [Mycobacterium sp.]|jgi:hypothetical protein|nr:lipocalin-like domain-containing protein [Mycobacterium sp.]
MSAITCTRAHSFGQGEDGLPQSLRGTWQLRDIVEVDAAGTVTATPYGAHPSGRLMYSTEGTMAVVIRAYGSSPAVAYAGEAHVEGSLIRHVIRVGLPPYTDDQVRRVRLTGGTKLVLATDTVDNRRVELHWERG